MIVTFLKTGLFSIHPVYGPVVACKAGSSANNMPDEQAQQLIDADWAREEVDCSTEQEPELKADQPAETQQTIESAAPPWLEQGWSAKRPDAKKRLEQWGKCELGVDIDRRKSVKNIIKQLKALQNDS